MSGFLSCRSWRTFKSMVTFKSMAVVRVFPVFAFSVVIQSEFDGSQVEWAKDGHWRASSKREVCRVGGEGHQGRQGIRRWSCAFCTGTSTRLSRTTARILGPHFQQLPSVEGHWRFRVHPLRAVRPGGQQCYAGPLGPEALLYGSAFAPLCCRSVTRICGHVCTLVGHR